MRRVSLQQTVERGIAEGAKSVFLFPGLPPLGNTGRLSRLEDYSLEEEDIEEAFRTTASGWQVERFQKQREIDYSYGIEKAGRFRVCAFSNMGQLALVMRLIPPEVPHFETLNLREGKTYQLCSSIELGSEYGMHTMEQRLNKMLTQKAMRWDDAIMTASIVEYIRQPRERGLT